jgi:hypothetical protein
MTVYTVQSTSWNFPPLVWFHSPIKLTTSVNLIEMRCLLYLCFIIFCCLGDTLTSNNNLQGRIQDFKLGGGGAFKKIALSGGGGEIFWGISCEKSWFYAKKSYFFQLRKEARIFFLVFRVKKHDFTPKNLIFSNWIRPWLVWGHVRNNILKFLTDQSMTSLQNLEVLKPSTKHTLLGQYILTTIHVSFFDWIVKDVSLIQIQYTSLSLI